MSVDTSKIFSWGEPACVAVSEQIAETCVDAWECVSTASIDEARALKSTGCNVVLVGDVSRFIQEKTTTNSELNDFEADLIDAVALTFLDHPSAFANPDQILDVPKRKLREWEEEAGFKEEEPCVMRLEFLIRGYTRRQRFQSGIRRDHAAKDFAREVYSFSAYHNDKSQREARENIFNDPVLFRQFTAFVGVRVGKTQRVPLIGNVVRGYATTDATFYIDSPYFVDYRIDECSGRSAHPEGFPRWFVCEKPSSVCTGLAMHLLYDDDPAPTYLVSEVDCRALDDAAADVAVAAVLRAVEENLARGERNKKFEL